jgi:hypothetical protein
MTMTNEQDVPLYDVRTLRAKPLPERMRLSCRAWVFQWKAPPRIVHLGYILKTLLRLAGGGGSGLIRGVADHLAACSSRGKQGA